MSNWQWLFAMMSIGWFGFAFGVRYAWNRNRINRVVWCLTHGTRRLTHAAIHDETPPWERRRLT